MAEEYPITTRQIVVTLLTETAKEVPGLRSVVGTYESVFNKIENNRIRILLEDVVRRLGRVEDYLRDEKKIKTLIYGCDQARGDILFEEKVEAYGSVTSGLIVGDADLEKVVEILDALRKLSGTDLKVLNHFWIGGKVWENRQVEEIAGYQRGVNPFPDVAGLRSSMEKLFPSLMRLQGLGILYVSPAHDRSGELPIAIGGLQNYLKQFAFLTEVGTRLVAVLPH